MKLRCLLALVAVCLVSATVALAGSNVTILSGTFETKISGKSSQLNGTWRITITQFGRSSTTLNGKLVVTGAIAASNGRFAITDTGGKLACKGLQVGGAYTYTLKGKLLTLKATYDGCSPRKTILTTHPLTKIR